MSIVCFSCGQLVDPIDTGDDEFGDGEMLDLMECPECGAIAPDGDLGEWVDIDA